MGWSSVIIKRKVMNGSVENIIWNSSIRNSRDIYGSVRKEVQGQE
jgi:hypothetical protein